VLLSDSHCDKSDQIYSMSPEPNTINLIRTKTSSSPQYDSIESSLRKSGYVGLIAFVCIGISLTVIYTLFYFQLQSLDQEKIQLVNRINASKSKEAMLMAIQNRTKVVSNVIKNQKPWMKILDLVSTFASAPLLTNISVDDQNKVVIAVKSQTLESVLDMVNIIISQTKDNQIRSPQLISFQTAKKGGVELTIAFFAVF
jgi:hypothetical protein